MDRKESHPHLELAHDLHGFFRGALGTALSERCVEVTEPTSHYLVALLADYAHPDEKANSSLDRPLPFLLAEALESTGSERFERLRMLGDTVLYTSGFFLDHLERRGVELDYVSALGAQAYDGAASMLRHAGRASGAERPSAPELFQELADGFTRFAQVLGTVADGLYASAARANPSSMVRLYERWLRTGSEPLASALTTHGVLPKRAPGGLN